MTNVPDDIRAMWVDVYKLFDLQYRMDIASTDAWRKVWEDASGIWEKYGRKDAVVGLLLSVADLLKEYRESGK